MTNSCTGFAYDLSPQEKRVSPQNSRLHSGRGQGFSVGGFEGGGKLSRAFSACRPALKNRKGIYCLFVLGTQLSQPINKQHGFALLTRIMSSISNDTCDLPDVTVAGKQTVSLATLEIMSTTERAEQTGLLELRISGPETERKRKFFCWGSIDRFRCGPRVALLNGFRRF